MGAVSAAALLQVVLGSEVVAAPIPGTGLGRGLPESTESRLVAFDSHGSQTRAARQGRPREKPSGRDVELL